MGFWIGSHDPCSMIHDPVAAPNRWQLLPRSLTKGWTWTRKPDPQAEPNGQEEGRREERRRAAAVRNLNFSLETLLATFWARATCLAVADDDGDVGTLGATDSPTRQRPSCNCCTLLRAGYTRKINLKYIKKYSCILLFSIFFKTQKEL